MSSGCEHGDSVTAVRSVPLVLAAGGSVGLLGGMIGLGGAEFRLPLLIGVFGFVALSAVIVNKAMSLVVVLFALPARLAAVPLGDLGEHWLVAANLLGRDGSPSGRPGRPPEGRKRPWW